MNNIKWLNSKRDNSRSIMVRSDEHIGNFIDKLREWALDENEGLIVMLESADMLEQLLIGKNEHEHKAEAYGLDVDTMLTLAKSQIQTVAKCNELQEQIERMAEFISKMDIDESICKKVSVDCNADYSQSDTYISPDEYCASCIIKYFESETE